jgi:hypothetical protein
MSPPSIRTGTSWVLARNGQRLTCTLIADDGHYTLRLTHRGQTILNEVCEGPQHALSRSIDTLTALLTNGWISDQSVN